MAPSSSSSPNNFARRSNDHATGGLITFIEGYFKALALDLAGVESVAFTGITVYRIDPALREYLIRRRPDRIFIMYDADALDVSSSSPASSNNPAREGLAPSPAISSRRNQDFANSARKFATALFSLFSSVDHTCQIVFVMGKPGNTAPPPCGIKKRIGKGFGEILKIWNAIFLGADAGVKKRA